MMPRFCFLNGNILKIIAMVTMLIDHMGVILFHEVIWLRIIGRIAFPIFAFFIAEGCLYTKNKLKYILLVAGLGIVCQIAYFINDGSLYMCTLITFAMSIGIIYLLQAALKKSGIFWLLFGLSIAASYIICELFPNIIPKSFGFHVDYGFCGVMLPVLVYAANIIKKNVYIWKLVFLCIGMAALAMSFTMNYGSGNIQWYSFISLIFIAFYNGKRGRLKLKYLFYIFYPVHLLILYGITFIN